MDIRRERILTIDDDSDILDVLELTLSEYYEVYQAPNGEEGLKVSKEKNPDLIICDYVMPKLNGRDFCKALKKDILMQHIPVIMLTGKKEAKDIIGGIDAGADDYLVKPFEPDTLLARIRMILRRTSRSLDANPLTHLPGNTSIMEEIHARIENKNTFAVGYLDIDKFKAYNDKYGFEKGDDVIRTAARLLIHAAEKAGGENSFVGHIGGDDFVYITDDKYADKVAEAMISEFDKIVPKLYTPEDAKKGFIIGKDRQGNETKFSLLSLSIGIVSNRKQPITHVAQVGEIQAELKKYAKTFDKSNFVRNKREA